MKSTWTILLVLIFLSETFADDTTRKQVDQLAAKIESQVVKWRRDFHQFPELSNREFKTSKKVADHLKSLGLQVTTRVAHTGVVAILDTGKPGPVVALRADMDALPVTERVDVPFASKEKATFNGQNVGVMHACGHDGHTAILMGVATILTQIKDKLRGKVKFIFQPAEEGPPEGENGGAKMMVEEGVLKNPDVDVIFGLHLSAQTDVGLIKYKPQGLLASADVLRIKVHGKQTHGSSPWSGVDPITISAQIILGLQTIISRQTPLTEEAAVISIGSIHSGVRFNIIPEDLEMIGTIRTLNTDMRDKILEKIRLTATKIAESAGATAEVEIENLAPLTYNDPELIQLMLPSLYQTAGMENVMLRKAVTGAEDFAYYSQKVPGFFFFLGGKPIDVKEEDSAPHHTPDFYIDESGFVLGVRALSNLTLDYMKQFKLSGIK